MTERTTETKVTFHLQALAQTLPPGTYRFVVRQDLIEGLSFPASEKTYRGLEIPAIDVLAGKHQYLKVDAGEIEAALERDRSDRGPSSRPM